MYINNFYRETLSIRQVSTSISLHLHVILREIIFSIHIITFIFEHFK